MHARLTVLVVFSDTDPRAEAPGVNPFDNRDERIERLLQATSAQRAGTAEEIADAVTYLLTASNFVTGQDDLSQR